MEVLWQLERLLKEAARNKETPSSVLVLDEKWYNVSQWESNKWNFLLLPVRMKSATICFSLPRHLLLFNNILNMAWHGLESVPFRFVRCLFLVEMECAGTGCYTATQISAFHLVLSIGVMGDCYNKCLPFNIHHSITGYGPGWSISKLAKWLP